MLVSLVVSSVLSLVPTWLVTRYLKDNAPDLGQVNSWLVGGVLGSAFGYLAWYLLDLAWDVAARNATATAWGLLALGACSGTFALLLTRPAFRARIDAYFEEEEEFEPRLRAAPTSRAPRAGERTPRQTARNGQARR